MTARFLLLLPLLAVLAACGDTGASTSGSGKSATIRSAGQPPRAPSRLPSRPSYTTPAPRPAPPVQSAPGLEGVIGADADQLTRLFGPPRLDVREEDARKLQWSGTACILDAYLYPATPGGRATASYVDSRRGDGRDVDRAACIAALKLSSGRPAQSQAQPQRLGGRTTP